MSIIDYLLMAGMLGLPALVAGVCVGLRLGTLGIEPAGAGAAGAIGGLAAGVVVAMGFVLDADHSDGVNAVVSVLAVPIAVTTNAAVGLGAAVLAGASVLQASSGADTAEAPSVASTSRTDPERQVKIGVSRSV